MHNPLLIKAFKERLVRGQEGEGHLDRRRPQTRGPGAGRSGLLRHSDETDVASLPSAGEGKPSRKEQLGGRCVLQAMVHDTLPVEIDAFGACPFRALGCVLWRWRRARLPEGA
jgi:hypothetical protein